MTTLSGQIAHLAERADSVCYVCLRPSEKDVVDVFFSILTNGKVTADMVGPHGDLLDEFPYLGPPHD